MNIHHLIAVAATLAVLPAPSLANNATLCEQSRQMVEARGLTGLGVENPCGRIRVVSSQDGRIHITALKFTSGGPSAKAKELARQTRVEILTEGGRQIVRVRYPQRQVIRISFLRLLRGELDVPRVEVRLLLEVPPGLPVELESTSGNLETSDRAGSQRLETTSGDIVVRGAAAAATLTTTSGDISASGLGRARVRSVSGDVVVEGARGPLDVHTSSGDVNLSGAADSLRIETISGDVRVDGAPRGLDAGTTSGELAVTGPVGGVAILRSTSGDLHLELGATARRADVHAVSGAITVRLPEGLGCSLTLTSTSGTLDATVPMQVRTMTRHELSGVVSGGGIPVSLHSVSGDITVSGGRR